MCTDACVLVRGHVFVGVLIKPRTAVVGKMKSRLDLIMQCVGSFVQLDLLLYRLLGLIVQFVGCLHLDLFSKQHVGSLCV